MTPTILADYDLHIISELCASLCYVNLKGCISISDGGIAVVIVKCIKLHSIVVCDTSFGQTSVASLCSCTPGFDKLDASQTEKKPSVSLACKLQKLHMGGCKGEFHFL